MKHLTAAPGQALATLGITLGIALAAPATGSAASRPCSRFIVGDANSTAYLPSMKLPAAGSVKGVSCRYMRRMARAGARGTLGWPEDRQFTPGFEWPDYVPVSWGDGQWECASQNRGLSGPSYAVRCKRGSDRASWRTLAPR